jgi:hypothetical protein
MKADFLDAHERHWIDAQGLFQAERWANADHLYGVSAECGLKRLMLAFGMPYDSLKDRPGKDSDRKHIDLIWTRFESYRCGHPQATGYSLAMTNPFSNWNVAQRYARQSNFNQTRVKAHQAGVILVRSLVQKAKLEGLIV